MIIIVSSFLLISAIQFERDTIGSPKKGRRDSSPQSNCGTNPVGAMTGTERSSDVIDVLMDMEARVVEEMSLRYRNSMMAAAQGEASDSGDGSIRPCTVDDLNEISRTTLLLMVEWAKNMQPFPDLSMEDKIILLKNYAPQHLILMPAFRSPDTTRVCLFNNTYVGRDQASSNGPELNGFAAFKTSNITPRVLDEIVWPMRQLQMKEQEFVCLKALAFLHPEAKGLSTTSQALIREARNNVLKALYSFILTQNPEDAPTRYGNILLLAPALKALTQLLIENMTLTKFFGLAEVDSLLSEFILDDLNDQSSAPVSIKEHLSGGPNFSQNNLTNTSTLTSSSVAGGANEVFYQPISVLNPLIPNNAFLGQLPTSIPQSIHNIPTSDVTDTIMTIL